MLQLRLLYDLHNTAFKIELKWRLASRSAPLKNSGARLSYVHPIHSKQRG